ncbi:signal transducer and activator of transcription 6 isoform X1 [Amphiprion ocellaris]|uniref:Signal transducer and activator of transcription n=1 Tax=Amphiprion ocellaris TaxID=80972 RepID=A0AAQ6A4T0_AMPOC|nr:signal transducer and activator of transcription 6 isoform X1 [Amphiprion ocellaris]XP_054868681.1 signal transducer and activator of transcription 6 isoform X1 [Amphiprion ocellaris]
MAQWIHMYQMLQCLPDDTVNSLYPPATFPIEVRHYGADWIESQRWEDFSMEKMEQESKAQTLLEQTVSMLQTIAQQKTDVVERMKLMQISRNMAMFQPQPLQFVVMVRDILRKERVLISANNAPQYQMYPSRDNMQDVEHLGAKVVEVQNIRKKMHQLQEELNWERQNFESLQGPFQQNGLDSARAEIQKLQNHIQQLEFNVNTMATKRFQLLKDCVDCLDLCQSRLITRLKDWRWEQHKAAIGHPFDDNLIPLQNWCEQLLGMNGNLRQELMLIGERISDLQERLGQLLQVLIQSSLVVDKQPPQVIKTQSKFSTTVRYLLGEKVAPGKPVVLKAQIINELQARNLGGVPGDNVGELINNSAILEHNTASKSTCATFRNMSIKKIKRADRKGSESVTEEKFALLFSTEITITGCDTPYRIQMISQPVVVIVHGSQDNNAVATIIWDCAFSERDRVPFVVPERVPWRMMCSTLNCKFTSEVQTQHNLDHYNQHFLAQKIFDKPDFAEDFSNMMVSWAQFNKEVLPGRPFTFWQWFEGVMELTKKHLKTYWSEGLIFGFIGKQHLHLILKDRPNGTFLLRFSDSEIGGITIAYVSATENGGQKIQNIQPFTKRDLEIRSLGDRIRDINHITYLYPEFPKHEVFKKFYTEPQVQSCTTGYIPVSLHTKVGTDATPMGPHMAPLAENAHFSVDASALGASLAPLNENHPSAFLGDATPSPPNMASLNENSHVGFSVHPFQSPFNSQEIPSDIIESPTTPHHIPAGNDMDIDLDSIIETLNS